MAPGFVAGFVRWLQQMTALRVAIARSGDPCAAGQVYLPPDGHDLTVDAKRTLAVTPGTGPHCPSGDRLLTSLAHAYGSRAAGVVLTGMGDDGALGLLAIRVASGVTIAQDEDSSVVYGMPRAAVEIGATTAQLALAAIPKELIHVTARGALGLGGAAR
jgi:two-component system chemotaxis response regulator CheB